MCEMMTPSRVNPVSERKDVAAVAKNFKGSLDDSSAKLCQQLTP
jgi:hypothetical protein